jgi:predicted DNA-binding transcriptional regulator
MLSKALGHPARVAIMRLLIARGECMCGAIVDELPLAQATVSQHLKVLKDAGLVQGEIVFVLAALFAAGVLSSLPPPSSALARVQDIAARVGPGPVTTTVSKSPYKVQVRVTPNRAAVENSFRVSVTRDGEPVPGAEVVTRFDMLDMEMGEQSYKFRELRPGVFSKSAPALVMVGHWALQFEVTPPGGTPFVVTLLDKASG